MNKFAFTSVTMICGTVCYLLGQREAGEYLMCAAVLGSIF